MIIEEPKLKTRLCKHCGNEGVVLRAVNWDEEGCWDCVRAGIVSNPTGLGWC